MYGQRRALPVWWFLLESFLLAAAGTRSGPGLRSRCAKSTLTFERLAAPDEQLLDTPFRIVFVIVLTMAACLLFWTGAINVRIGDLNTEASWFSKAGSITV